MKSRDERLTEAMGKCLHLNIVPDEESGWSACVKCGDLLNAAEYQPSRYKRNFSTWQMFGRFWDWAREQKWWDNFRYEWLPKQDRNCSPALDRYIHPDRFANAVDEYLQGRES